MALVGAGSALGGVGGGNTLARLLVVISGDTSGLDKAIARANGTVSGFASNMGAIGGAMTRAITLPLLAVGGASVALASQFQSALGRVAGLTPVLDDTGQSIEEVGQSLLDLAKVVPTSPVDLANALYFAGSAGLKFSDAMAIVDLSARGAAIGMGQASDISRVLIAALNNFGEPAGGPLTAARAMDALTVAIREGTAEPAEMAIALGRVLPIAKEAGITFQETVGALASLTNVGLPARVATTSLRALFQELLSPTKQANEQLQALGITYEQLAGVLRTGGPIAAFRLIEHAVNGDQEALRNVIPQIRGMTAYLGVADDRLETSARIMEKTTNSAGALAKAFQIIQKTPQFRFEVGLNKLRVAAIELGGKMIPVFVKIADVIGGVADEISNFSNVGKGVALVVLGIVASIGPLLKMLAALGIGVESIVTSFATFAKTAAIGAAAALAAYGAFKSLQGGSTSLFSSFTLLAGGAVAAFSALRILQGLAVKLGADAFRLGNAFIEMSTGGLALAAVGIAGIVTVVTLFIAKANAAQKAANEMGDALFQAAQAGQTMKQAISTIKDDNMKALIQATATELGLLNRPIATGWKDLRAGLGTQLITDLQKLRANLVASGEATDEDTTLLNDYIAATIDAVKKNTYLGQSFKKAGLPADGFSDILYHVQSLLADNEDGSVALGYAIRDEGLAYDQVRQQIVDYDRQQQASMLLQIANQRATQQYARDIGVSADYLTSRMQEVGFTAAGASEDAKRLFERLAFGATKSGQTVQAATAEMRDSIAQDMADITEAVDGGFSAFERADNKIKPLNKLLGFWQTNVHDVVSEMVNMRALAERGVPGSFLKKFVAGNAPLAARLVDMSEPQLQKLLTLYDTYLGAIDADILDEANHQGMKGSQMVQSFTSGIISNRDIAPRAALQVVNSVTQAISSGDLKPAGAHLIQRFADGVSAVKGLSTKQVTDAVQYMAQQVIKNDWTHIGKQQARELVNGLVNNLDIPRGKAKAMVDRVADETRAEAQQRFATEGRAAGNMFNEGVRSPEVQAKSNNAGAALGQETVQGARLWKGAMGAVGSGYGTSFVAGIASQADEAYSAGAKLGNEAKRGTHDGLTGSPKYFTYYAGIELANQLAEGVDKGIRTTRFKKIRFPISMTTQGRMPDWRPDGMGTKSKYDFDLDVTLDRTRTARALDWSARVRGD